MKRKNGHVHAMVYEESAYRMQRGALHEAMQWRETGTRQWCDCFLGELKQECAAEPDKGRMQGRQPEPQAEGSLPDNHRMEELLCMVSHMSVVVHST